MSSKPPTSHKFSSLLAVFQQNKDAAAAQNNAAPKKTAPAGAPKKMVPKATGAAPPTGALGKLPVKQTGAVQGGTAKSGPRPAPPKTAAQPPANASNPASTQPSSSAVVSKPTEQAKPVQSAPVEEEITYSTFEDNSAPVAASAGTSAPSTTSTTSQSSTTPAVSDADAVYSEFEEPAPRVVAAVAIAPTPTSAPATQPQQEEEGAVYSEFAEPTPAVAAVVSSKPAAAVRIDLGQPSYEGVEQVPEEAVYTEFAEPSASGYAEDMDLSEDAQVEHKGLLVTLTTSTSYIGDASGYLDASDDVYDSNTSGGYADDASIGSGTDSGYTDDAYGVLDLSEATLNAGAYLIESDVSESPSEASDEKPTEPEPSAASTAARTFGFASAYIDLDIDDPAISFVLKEGTEYEDDDSEEEEDVSEPSVTPSDSNIAQPRGRSNRDSLDLLRRSNSTSSLRLRRTGSLSLMNSVDNGIVSLNSSTSSGISSATSSGYASFDTDAQRVAVGSSSSGSSSMVSPRSGSHHPLLAPRPGANGRVVTSSNAPQGKVDEYFSLSSSAASAISNATESGYVSHPATGSSSSDAYLTPAPAATTSSGLSPRRSSSGGLNLSGGSSSSGARRNIHGSGDSHGSERRSGNRNLPDPSRLVNAQVIQEVLDSKESWNDRFQAIYDAPESESKYDALHRLSVDFLGVAETYGKVIISELSLPDSEKSIPPINIGGVAGGSKYAVRGLLFKFAVDVPPHFLYGSDEYAQKAAGHELKGLNQWALNSDGLHFPLMALVRYCGFTLVALSMLPIGGNVNGKNSLVYGSDDAGRTVHFDDDAIYDKMKQTALALNLKGHYLVADTSRLMYGPGDIEGHLGSDGLHYALDYARVYPPAALVQGEIKEKSRCLFRLLRPELVSRFTKPLSSDAFTAWGRMNSDIHNAEVREATQYLVDQAIPALAHSLPPNHSVSYWLNLRRDFHLHGVNIRYMGLVRRVTLSQPHASCVEGSAEGPDRWLLREMVVRVIKSTLNQKWRELIKKYQRITPDRCIQEAIGVINAAIEPQTTAPSKSFWGKTIRDMLSVKFPLALTDEEKELDLDENGALKSEPKINLQKLVFDSPTAWHYVFIRLTELTGMVFNPQVTSMQHNVLWPQFGVLTSGDVLEIRSAVKQMSLVDFAFVMAKSLNGLRQMSPALATRLFALAIQRLKESPQISLVILRRVINLKSYIIRTLKRMKWADALIKAVAEFVDVALDGAQLMCNNVPTDLAVDAAMFLHEIHATTSADAKIISYLQRAIDTDPKNVRPYLEIAKIHVFGSRPNLSEEARIWLDRVLEIGSMDPLIRLQVGLLLLSAPNTAKYAYMVGDEKSEFESRKSAYSSRRNTILQARAKLEENKEIEAKIKSIAAAKVEAAAQAEAKAASGETGETTSSETENSEAAGKPESEEDLLPKLLSDEERTELEKVAAQEPPTEEEANAEWVQKSPEEMGCPVLAEVISLWLPIKEQHPSLFAELDYHIFLPRADNVEPIEHWLYPLTASMRAGSFHALAYVASRLKCAELDSSIRELMQAGVSSEVSLADMTGAEFTTLLIFLNLCVPFDSCLVNYLASIGPYNTVTRLIIHGKADTTRFTASEAEFGRFIKAFPKLTSLCLPEDLRNITGSVLADFAYPRILSLLDLTGTSCTGEDFEAFTELLTKDLVKPAAHLEIVIQATTPPTPEPVAEGEEPTPAPTTPQEAIISVYNSQLSLATLLMPQTIDTESASRSLNMLSGLANLQHLTVGGISDSLITSMALFGASLQFLSVAGIEEVDVPCVEKLLKLLPNLMMLDAAKTNFHEARATGLLSRPRLHPTLEVLIVASEVMHFFTASKPRLVYITPAATAGTGKGALSFDLPALEWASLDLKRFCMPHTATPWVSSRWTGHLMKTAVLQLFLIEKPFHGNAPLTLKVRARDFNHLAYTAKAAIHQNTLSWTINSINVAEVKVPTNFGAPPTVGFLNNGRLEHKNVPMAGGGVVRLSITIPGAPTIQSISMGQFQRAPLTFPAGMHINYAAMAYITLCKQTQ